MAGHLYTNYGEVDALTAEASAQCARLRDQIIPDIKTRWDETVAGFTGQGSDAFQDITRVFHASMSALEESLKNLNSMVIEVAASGGSVQLTDKQIAGLFS